jgi:hypothetical protein
MRYAGIFALLLIVIPSLAQAPSGALPRATETRTAARTTPVGVGEVAPGFELLDHRGGLVRLSAPGDAKATVLVFYRGYW